MKILFFVLILTFPVISFLQSASSNITTETGQIYQRSVLLEKISNSRNAPKTFMDEYRNSYHVSIMNDHFHVQKFDSNLNLIGSVEYDLGEENFDKSQWAPYYRNVYFYAMGDKIALFLKFEDLRYDLFHFHLKFFNSNFEDVTDSWQFVTTTKGSGYGSLASTIESRKEKYKLKNFTGSNAEGVYFLYYRQIENIITYTLKWYDNDGLLKVSREFISDITENPLIITSALLGEDNSLYLTNVNAEGEKLMLTLRMDGQFEEDKLAIKDKYFFIEALIEHEDNIFMIGINEEHVARVYGWEIGMEASEIFLPQLSSLYCSSIRVEKVGNQIGLSAIMWGGDYKQAWKTQGNVVIGNYLFDLSNGTATLEKHYVISESEIKINKSPKIDLQKEMVIDKMIFNSDGFVICYNLYTDIVTRSEEPLGAFTYNSYSSKFTPIIADLNFNTDEMTITKNEIISRYFEDNPLEENAIIEYKILADDRVTVPDKIQKKSLVRLSQSGSSSNKDYLFPLGKEKGFEFLGAYNYKTIQTENGHTELYFRISPNKYKAYFFFAKFTIDENGNSL